MTARASESGQTSVELVLAFPLIAVLLLAVVQVGLVVRDHVLVGHAAREAVRVASVDDDPEAPRRAALASSPFAAERLEVHRSDRGASGSRVVVEIRYRSPTEVPLVGALLDDVEVRSEATMRVE
jgi:Flp pilus assembly protein TadG